MIKFIKSFFRKDLTKILSIFDKAHRELDEYIDQTSSSLKAASEAAKVHADNLATAEIVKGNLISLTSTAQAVK